MKERSQSYLRTFQNTPEGNVEYKAFLSDIRKFIKGGRICKFFRNGTRRPYGFHHIRKGICLNDGTHFDVYLLETWKGGHRTGPKFFEFALK